MLTTEVTTRLGICAPIIGAPMAGWAHGALARAVTEAGGLGMIGVGNASTAGFVREEAAVAREGGRAPFGVGLQAWALEHQPGVFEATLEVAPTLVSVSFGDLAPYVHPLHEVGSLVASQVNDVAEAERAVEAGVDFIVAQGTEAGGHTGAVATLPLLQAVLERVDVPVLAAGGIASGRGVAAVLAAGAQAAWVGTALLACPEAAGSPAARQRVLAAGEHDTVLTRVFDLAQGLRWPERYPGRALRNEFTTRWHGREADLVEDARAGDALREARQRHDYDVAYIYAGQASTLVRAERPAGEVVRDLVTQAERHLESAAHLLQP